MHGDLANSMSWEFIERGEVRKSFQGEVALEPVFKWWLRVWQGEWKEQHSKQGEGKVSKNLEVGIWKVYAKVVGWKVTCGTKANFSISLYVCSCIKWFHFPGAIFYALISSSEPLFDVTITKVPCAFFVFHAYDCILHSILITYNGNKIWKYKAHKYKTKI